MLYRNERAHNQRYEAGNVLQTFEKLRNLVNVNDGTHSFSFRTTDAHDQPAPFFNGQYSAINLTHPDHFISDVDKGFLTFHVKLDLQLNTDLSKLASIDDPNNFYKLFVGFKSSNQIFDRLEILHNNVSVGYQQNECIREGFLYSVVKPEEEKKRRRFVHSLWENVINYSQTVAGTYVNLNSFKTNGKTEVEFDLNVPFDDLLALQAFDLFPNGIIGDLSIRFQVSPAGLVWAVLDPYTVAETKIFLEDNDSITTEELEKLKLIKARSHLKHHFTQIGNDALILTKESSPDPSPSPSPTPTPSGTVYRLTYQAIEHKEDVPAEEQTKYLAPKRKHPDYPDQTDLFYMDFDYSPESFTALGFDLSTTNIADITDTEIVMRNPDEQYVIDTANGYEGPVIYRILKTPLTKQSLYAQHDALLAEQGTQKATLTCNRMTITLCKSNMQGYGICEKSRAGITEILREGIIIPSQKVEFHSFPMAASTNGIKSTLNIPLVNVTSMNLMFPKHHNDLTIFENPVYQSCYLNIGGKNFPDENLSTIGARFFESQLTANDLDAINITCTKEFEDSMTMPRNDASGKRYKNTLSDATSFIFNVQTERSSAGYTFDGIDAGVGNCQVQISGQPIFTGVNDTYYNVNEEGTLHPPPVQLFLVRDTYFRLSLDGLMYVDVESPPGSQVDE